MKKQFLLNADGSIPSHVDVELLTAQGIPLVLPTPIPREPGMVAVEQEPQLGADGIWRQVWALEPAPEPEPVELPADPLASLTNEQKQALLALLSASL